MPKTKNSFHNVTWNLDLSMVRNDTMEGRDYTVVPMVMLVEGVHAGSHGPLFYPRDEIEKTPQVWNHKPIVVYHPSGDTACDPAILTNRKIGVIMNTKGADGKLKAEAWLELDRMEKVDKRVAEAVENQTMMELSTGLYCDCDGIPGEWNGEAYDGKTYNYRPDHLAVLPDKIGACSIEDGAGFLRLNEEVDPEDGGITEAFRRDIVPLLNRCGIDTNRLVALEMSQSDIRNKIHVKIREVNGDDTWLEEVYDDRVIYSNLDGKLFQVGYKFDRKENVTLVGIPVQVERIVSYETVKNSTKGKIMNKVKKDALIEGLIDNESTQWTEDDREVLNALEDDVLEKLVPVENETPEETKGKPDDTVQGRQADVKNEIKVNEDEREEEVTVDGYIANAPPEIRDMLQAGMTEHNAKKAMIIGVIMKNEGNKFSKEHLESKPLHELDAIASLLPKPKKDTPAYNYAGMGEPAQVSNEGEVLELPKMEFSSTG